MKALRAEDLTCRSTGKRAYVTEEAADRAMRRSWERGMRGDLGRLPRITRYYRCDSCGFWHLTGAHRVKP